MRRVKLGTICDTCLGKMLDAEKNKGTFQPYLANINVRWGTFDLRNLSLMKFQDDEQERYGLKYGDLVICEGGEPGRCAIWKDEIPNMKIQKALHRVRPHEDLDNRYLYYWFLVAGKNNLLDRYFTTTTIKHLPGDKLKDIEIDLPDIILQKNIADVLSSLDDKIQLNSRIIAELEAMAKTIYDYWFVQFDFPNAEGKPYRSSGGSMEWNTQIKREIPKGWENGNLYDIADYINGLACQNFRPKEGEDYLPIVKIKEMHEGVNKDTEMVSINIPDKNKIETGDILFSWSATLGVMYWSGGDAGLNQHIFKIVPRSFYSKEYVYHQLTTYVINFVKMAEARKTTMGHITSDHLSQSQIILPPNSIVDKFNVLVSPMHTKILMCSREKQELEKLRDWLLPMLMNGQVTVE